MQHLQVAYNDSYRILHGLPRNTSAMRTSNSNDIATFDALLRKPMIRFIGRSRKSDDSSIR